MKFVVIFGPSAVGKMTVGEALARKSGLLLFHNHILIEPLLKLFPWGSPTYRKLLQEFRHRIFEEIAAGDSAGMIFTYVWALECAEDKAQIDAFSKIFKERGAEICFVELFAPQEERLKRNATEARLAEKASKRDVEWSNANLKHTDAEYQLNTKGEFFYPELHLKIDNSLLDPDIVADKIIERFW